MIKILYYKDDQEHILYPPQDSLINLIPYVRLIAEQGKVLYNKSCKQYLASPANVLLGIDEDIIEVPMDKDN